METTKYRIVEQNNKFHIEHLLTILWWKIYVPIKEYNEFYNGNIIYFDTLEDAKQYIKNDKITYHYIEDIKKLELNADLTEDVIVSTFIDNKRLNNVMTRYNKD